MTTVFVKSLSETFGLPGTISFYGKGGRPDINIDVVRGLVYMTDFIYYYWEYPDFDYPKALSDQLKMFSGSKISSWSDSVWRSLNAAGTEGLVAKKNRRLATTVVARTMKDLPVGTLINYYDGKNEVILQTTITERNPNPTDDTLMY